MNRAQAYKWLGDEKKASQIVKAEDWTAANDAFQLAEAVLLDDFKRAASLMHRIGSKSRPSENDYREWPLFREFRRSKEFEVAFEEVFGKPVATSIETSAGLRDEQRVPSDGFRAIAPDVEANMV